LFSKDKKDKISCSGRITALVNAKRPQIKRKRLQPPRASSTVFLVEQARVGKLSIKILIFK